MKCTTDSGLLIYGYTEPVNCRRVSNNSKNKQVHDSRAEETYVLLHIVTCCFFE